MAAVIKDRTEPAISHRRHVREGAYWAHPNQALAKNPRMAPVIAASRRYSAIEGNLTDQRIGGRPLGDRRWESYFLC